MKKVIGIFLALVMMVGSCSPKPMYKTKEGKRKLKHYNQLQFGDPRAK